MDAHIVHDIVTDKKVLLDNFMLFYFNLETIIRQLSSNWSLVTFYDVFEFWFVNSLTLVGNFGGFVGWGQRWCWGLGDCGRWLGNVADRYNGGLADGFLGDELDLLWTGLIFRRVRSKLFDIRTFFLSWWHILTCPLIWRFFHVWRGLDIPHIKGRLFSHVHVFGHLLKAWDRLFLFLGCGSSVGRLDQSGSVDIGLRLVFFGQVKGLIEVERTLGLELLFFGVIGVVISDCSCSELPEIVELGWFSLLWSLNVGSCGPNVSLLENSRCWAKLLIKLNLWWLLFFCWWNCFLCWCL